MQKAFDEFDVRLIVTAGDNIYAGNRILGLPIGAQGDEDDDWFFTFYQPYRYIVNRVPVYPCIGNHDTGETEDRDDRDQLLDNMGSKVNKGSPDDFARAHTISWSDNAHFLLVTIAGDEMRVQPIGELIDGTLEEIPRFSPTQEKVPGPIIVRR